MIYVCVDMAHQADDVRLFVDLETAKTALTDELPLIAWDERSDGVVIGTYFIEASSTHGYIQLRPVEIVGTPPEKIAMDKIGEYAEAVFDIMGWYASENYWRAQKMWHKAWAASGELCDLANEMISFSKGEQRGT